MEKIWSKFHPLYGPDLKVGFETTFSKEKEVILDPLYGKSGLVHKPANETLIRVYEPALQVFGSCLDSDAAQVFFEPVPPDGSLFRRLVFARKFEHSTQRPRYWMVAARHGESTHFGFDSWNSKDQRYLALAYPGESGQFVPVYFKIQMKGGEFVFLEVWAWGEDRKEGENQQVVVQAWRVKAEEVPELLVSAKPGLVYSI